MPIPYDGYRRFELRPSTEKSLERFGRKGKTIVIYGVPHFADKTFYETVTEMIHEDSQALGSDNGAEHVVHVEGVSPCPDGESWDFSHVKQRVCEITGLVPQDELLDEIDDYEVVDISWEELSRWAKKKVDHDVRRLSDVVAKISTMNPDERLYASMMLKKRILKEPSQKRWSVAASLIPGVRQIMKGRSRFAAKYADLDPRNVSMVWGGAHVEDMVKYLRRRGYRIHSNQKIMSKQERDNYLLRHRIGVPKDDAEQM